MEDVYEYRRAPGKGVILLAAMGVVFLLLVVVLAEADHLLWMVWVLGAMAMTWMLVPKPVYGIKVDADYLVLAAWRNPRFVRLDDIAYLRASNVSDETNIAIVYKNDEEEGIFAADLPDVDTLVAVMAAHGVPVRGVY